jgi:5,5'-dehydrodivanillate O-demethylase
VLRHLNKEEHTMTIVTPPEPLARVLTPYETGPGRPAGDYLRSFWQPVAMSSELGTGAVMPIRFFSEDFTLYRGAGGTPAVIAALCAHRLTKLSVGTVEGDELRCFFHGWKYGADGRCVEAPGQSASLVGRTSVRSYPTKEVMGLIFAYFGAGEPPRFPDIEGFSRTHGMDLVGKAPVRYNTSYRQNSNYYINVENTLDHAHVPFTHAISSNPNLSDIGFAVDATLIRDITVERASFGVKVFDVEEEGAPPHYSGVILPNIAHICVAQRIGYYETFGWRVPIDDNSHLCIAISGIHCTEAEAVEVRAMRERAAKEVAGWPPHLHCVQEILRGEKTVLDYARHPHLTFIEDGVAQGGIKFIDEPGRENMAQSDKGVLQLRRMFMSRLNDFVAGSPGAITEW